mgnify:CR=1 FL=1
MIVRIGVGFFRSLGPKPTRKQVRGPGKFFRRCLRTGAKNRYPRIVSGKRDAGGELVRAAAAALRPIVKRLLGAGVPLREARVGCAGSSSRSPRRTFPLADPAPRPTAGSRS